MNTLKIDLLKAKAVMLYISEKLGETDFLRAFKMLYFAEREHLAQYGRLIVGDTYYAMKNGPVPSFIYDALKYARENGEHNARFDEIINAISITSQYTFKANESADMDELSVSDISCLDKSVMENKDLSFKELSDKSHDSAWQAAGCDDAIDLIEIAKAGGADDEMLKYIEETYDCYNISLN